jgi:hypothetical protein
MYVGSSFHTVGPDMANDLEANVLRFTAGTFKVLATLSRERMLYWDGRALIISRKYAGLSLSSRHLKAIHATFDLIQKCRGNQCKHFRASVKLSANFHFSTSFAARF